MGETFRVTLTYDELLKAWQMSDTKDCLENDVFERSTLTKVLWKELQYAHERRPQNR